jgi:hypothetical protein
LTWRLPILPENAWLIEPRRNAPRNYAADFTTAFGKNASVVLTLHFADDLVDASLDGIPLKRVTGYDGMFAVLTAPADGEHRLHFITRRDFPAKPYLWLKGAFTLRSLTPYEAGPNHTVRTEGPFVAGNEKVSAGGELAAGGFPFLHEPLVAESTFTLGEPSSALSFVGVDADAIRASVDGKQIGWAWGPDWTLTLSEPLAAGEHTLRVELVPNSFNTYGPHHYYNGDWHVVSPGQILGEKNFADLPDAPDRTLVSAWHFRPLRLPTAIRA